MNLSDDWKMNSGSPSGSCRGLSPMCITIFSPSMRQLLLAPTHFTDANPGTPNAKKVAWVTWWSLICLAWTLSPWSLLCTMTPRLLELEGILSVPWCTGRRNWGRESEKISRDFTQGSTLTKAIELMKPGCPATLLFLMPSDCLVVTS